MHWTVALLSLVLARFGDRQGMRRPIDDNEAFEAFDAINDPNVTMYEYAKILAAW